METHSRAMVLGVWEGLLLCYLVDSSKSSSSSMPVESAFERYTNMLGTGLAFGVGGRLFLDYTTTGDVEVLARGVVGMTVGVLVGEFARSALLSFTDPAPVVSELKRKHTRRRVHTDEEVLEGNVPRDAVRELLPALTAAPIAHTTRTTNTIPHTSSSSSRSRPRVVTTTTTTATEPIPVAVLNGAPAALPAPPVRVLSAGVTRDMLRAGRRNIGANPNPINANGTEEDPDSERALERDVTAAESQRRVLQEEREWARAKGDAARSAELDAEIKRYKALSAELEARLKKRRSTVFCEYLSVLIFQFHGYPGDFLFFGLNFHSWSTSLPRVF